MSLPPGWSLRVVAATGSTNADLLAEAGAGATGEGTALLALRQEAGRGREGREWHSPEGNLHLSVLLRPACVPAAAGQLGMLAALALADLLGGLGVAARLKWPNDVLVDGAKLAGVLVEADLAGGCVAAAVVGIGLNVASFPAGLAYPATSLAMLLCGRPLPAPAQLGQQLLEMLAARYAAWRMQGFPAQRADWLRLGPRPGEPASVRIGARQLGGVFRDLDPEGALVLEVAPGRHRRILAGEVLPLALPVSHVPGDRRRQHQHRLRGA